jgi:hypothetical protein
MYLEKHTVFTQTYYNVTVVYILYELAILMFLVTFCFCSPKHNAITM